MPLMLGGEAGIEAVGQIADVYIETAEGPAQGLIIGVPDTADALVADQRRALALQVRAAEIAQDAGAKYIGLGNALAVVAGRGEALSGVCPLPVTTGHAATAWACAKIATEVLQQRKQRRVGLVGFGGTVGQAVAAVLRRQDIEVHVDASGKKVTRQAQSLGCIPCELEELARKSDILIGASTTGPMLDPGWLRDGATLVDLALPPTLRPGRRPPGLTVVGGETLEVPGALRGGFWGTLWLTFANYGHGAIYACLAEPVAMAMRSRRGWSQGRRLTPEAVAEVGENLEVLGFRAVIRKR